MPMQLVGRGLLIVWTDVEPSVEAAFNAWYDRDHARERVETVPGIVRVRRFVADDGGPKYLAAYDLQAPEVLFTEPYLALRRSRDPESQTLIPSFRNTLKVVGRIVAGEERAEGSHCALLRPATEVTATPGAEPRETLDALVQSAMAIEGVVAVRVARSEPALLELTRRFTTRSADRFLDSVVMLEATHADAMERALHRIAEQSAPAWTNEALITRLRFRYGLHAPVPAVELRPAPMH